MEKPIYVGCDDSGFEAKQTVLRVLKELDLPFVDCGSGEEPARYPWYAAKVASAVSEGTAAFGILICGSGIGMSIAANKLPGVRAAAVSDVYGARLTRRHNDSNVLCLGGRLLGPWQIAQIVRTWLTTAYDGGHHDGSLELIRQMEAVTMTGARWCPDEQPYPDFTWNIEQSL
jgi:ribose 5-phosphate isomerase B